jgi:hypothetical protein
LLRHLHKTAWDYVNRYKEAKASGNGAAKAQSAAKDHANV